MCIRDSYYAVRAFGKGRATRILAPIAALGMAGVLIHGAVSGRSTLAVHRVTLRSDRLPEAFDGLRIAQFTDLHIGTPVSYTHLSRSSVLRRFDACFSSISNRLDFCSSQPE